jgi:hypothetical protein
VAGYCGHFVELTGKGKVVPVLSGRDGEEKNPSPCWDSNPRSARL